MSTSIPVLNKNQSLPPLLLPASRPVEGVRASNEVRRDPFSGGGSGSRSSSSSSGSSSVGVGEKRNSSSLEGLANLATTKRAKVDGAAAAAATATATSTAGGMPPAVQETQGPKSESFSSISSSVSGSVSPAHIGASAPPLSGNSVGVTQYDRFVREEFLANSGHSGSVTEKNSRQSSSSKITPPPACTTPERVSPRSSASGVSGVNSSSGKRQRVGPSCDGCRLKKIKCDAQVEILLQDSLVLSQLTHRLHQVVTMDEVSGMTVKVDLSAVPEDCVLVKHIDKIVMFKPCTSCNKRRASLDGQQVPLDGKNSVVTGSGCVFSKGFTRADINVFAKICKKIGEKPVQEMTVDDYHEAGF